MQLSSSLHSACRDPTLLELEQDLLQDSVLLLWETISPAFSRIHSHHPHTTRPLATSRRGKEVSLYHCAELLQQPSFFLFSPSLPLPPPLLLPLYSMPGSWSR